MVPVSQAVQSAEIPLPLALKALRAPFLWASVLPYIAGALLAPPAIRPGVFWLGLLAVASTHLSANLINDYADTRSGVDSRDAERYGLFGGSKLIHTGDLPAGFFLSGSVVFGVVALLAVQGLSLLTGRWDILLYAACILVLAWMYSCPPFQLSYRYLGEPVVFLLFGPAVVMGGYSLQTGAFPAGESLLLSLPFGLLTTLVLVANEVPDYEQDRRGGKRTWVHLPGPEKAYKLYLTLAAASVGSLLICIWSGLLSPWAYAGLLPFLAAAAAGRLLHRHPQSKPRCLQASKLTLGAQSFSAFIIILDLTL